MDPSDGSPDGPVDLEFRIELPPGMSEDELAARLRAQAMHLNELLAQPILDVQIGPGTHRSYGSDPDPRPYPSAWSGASPEQVGGLSPDAGFGRAPPPQAMHGGMPNLRYDLNHPTSPVGPRFMMDGSYWQQRKGSRISERKEAEERARLEKESEAPPPFRARPVPPSVTAPLYQAIQAQSRPRRSLSAEPTAHRRGRTSEAHGPHGREPRDSSSERRAGSRVRESSEERRPAFRARPVPWCVSAPLYDQMLIEDNHARQERMHARSRAQIRTSSLPPRLEAVRRRLCGDTNDLYPDANSIGQRSSTPVPPNRAFKGATPKNCITSRPMKAEIPKGVAKNSQTRSASAAAGVGMALDAAENLSRDVAAGSSRVGWGTTSVHGSSYGISHVARHKTPPRSVSRLRAHSQERHANRPYNTTEVPDFAAMHEKQRRDRMKYSNRVATQPEPFVFSVPNRSLRTRQPPLPKDPSKDPRFHRRPRSARRPQSAPHGSPAFAAGPEAGSPSVRSFERPPVTGPPRTTLKTLQAQEHVANTLVHKRVEKALQEQHVERARKVDPEMRARIRAAVGPIESTDEIVERQVNDKRRSQRETLQGKKKDLQDIAEKVKRRPLLMQQTDSVARARRLALFQFRGFLKDAGVANPDSHFQDDELDDLDRARSDAAAAGGM